jgi:hypothetical protein
MVGETSDAAVLIIASTAIGIVVVKKRPRARAVVGAATYFFIPMALSHAWIFDAHPTNSYA